MRTRAVGLNRRANVATVVGRELSVTSGIRRRHRALIHAVRALAWLMIALLPVIALGCGDQGTSAPSSSPTSQEASENGQDGWPGPPSPGAKGSEENPIRIGSIKITGFAPAYEIPEIAKRHGWHVEVLDFPSSSQRAAALLRGEIDIAMLGWTATVSLAAEGEPVVAIANAFGGGQAIVAKTNSGIEEVADLKGKTVATLKGSMNEMHLLSQLEEAGVDAREVNIVHMNLEDMPIALARGDIDAMVGGEPMSSQAIVKGFGKLVKYPYDTSLGNINANMATTRSFLADNQEAVEVVLRAFVESTNALKSDHSRLLQIAKELFKADDEIAEMALKNTYLDYEVDMQAVQAMIDWQHKLGSIESKPSPDEFVDLSILNSITGNGETPASKGDAASS